MSLLKNSTIVITGVFISNLLAYAFHFIAGRMLGPAEYGVFGSLMSLFLLVALPAGALSSAITKYAAIYHSDNEFWKIVVLRKVMQNNVLVFSGIILLFIIIFSKFIASFLKIDSVTPVIIVGINLIFALLLPINRGILQGLKKFRVLSWNTIIEALSRLLFLVILLYLGFGVNGTIWAYGLAYLVASFWVIPFIIKETKMPIVIDGKIEMKPIYKFVFHVMLVSIILQSILNIPSLFVKHFYSSEFTGYWTAAINIARLSLFVSVAIAQVMFPEIAGEKDNKKKKKIFWKAALLVLLASAGMALLFFVFPQIFIQILYGSAYLGAVQLLQWLSIAMIFLGLINLWANYWLARIN